MVPSMTDKSGKWDAEDLSGMVNQMAREGKVRDRGACDRFAIFVNVDKYVLTGPVVR